MDTTNKRRRRDLSDLQDVWDKSTTVFIVITVILVVWLLIGVVSGSCHRDDTKYNQRVEFFNGFTAEQRQWLADNNYGITKHDLDEDYIAQPREVGGTTFGKYIKGSWLAIVIGCYCIVACWTFVALCINRRKDYYLGDIPFLDEFSGARLWLMMLPLLPMLLVFKLVAIIGLKRQENDSSQDDTHVAVAPHDFVDEDEYEETRPPLTEKIQYIPELTEKEYVELATTAYRQNRSEHIVSVSTAIENLREDNKDLHTRIQIQNREIGEYKAELAKLNSQTEPDTKDLAYEYNTIKQLRGVIGAAVNSEHNGIDIFVVVHAPYHGKFYDFGEWTICVNMSERVLAAYPERRIVNFPYIDCGRFCFGDRRGEIIKMMNAGRFLDAVILAIDAMHHINGTTSDIAFMSQQEPLTDDQLLPTDVMDAFDEDEGDDSSTEIDED